MARPRKKMDGDIIPVCLNLTKAQYIKLQEIAAHNEVTMVGQVRTWIAKSHGRITK